MKTLLQYLGFVALLLLYPLTAHAAPAITVSVRDTGVAQVTAKDFEPGTFCTTERSVATQRACSAKCERGKDDDEPACVKKCGNEPAFSAWSVTAPARDFVLSNGPITDSRGAFAAWLLQAGSVWCVAPDKDDVVQAPVTIPNNTGVQFPLSSTTGAWRSFENPNRFAWMGWDHPAFLRVLDAELKEDWSCTFSPASKPVNGCQLTRAVGSGGGLKLVFDSERPLSKDTTIAVALKKTPAKTLITVSLDQCTYTVKSGSAAGLEALYADSEEQRIELSASLGCLNQLEASPSVTLVLGSTTIQATLEISGERFEQAMAEKGDAPTGTRNAPASPPPPPDRAGARVPLPQPAAPCSSGAGQPPCSGERAPGGNLPTSSLQPKERKHFLRTGKIAADIAVGTQDIEIRTAQSVLGSLRVLVRPPGVRAATDAGHHPALSVSYGPSELDAWHSGKAVDGLAVVTPKEADDNYAIYNGATVEVESSLQRLGERLSPGGVEALKACQALWSKYQSNWFETRADDNYKQASPLDPTSADAFCKPGVFRDVALPVAKNEKDEPSSELSTARAKLAQCLPLALEGKVDVCREKLDEGQALFDVLQDQELDAFRNRRAWRLKGVSWGSDVWFDEDWLRRAEARQSNVSRVRFAIYQPQTQPFEAVVELRNQEGELLFRSNVVLADGARRESLPLAIGNALRIECGTTRTKKASGARRDFSDELPADFVVRDTVRNGVAHAVYDDDLDSGHCALVYSPADMKRFLGRGEKIAALGDDAAPQAAASADATAVASPALNACQAAVAQRRRACARSVADSQAACLQVPKGKPPGTAQARGLCGERARSEGAVCTTRAAREQDACATRAADDDVDPLLHLYGAQLVEVVITRGSEPSVTKSWSFDPSKGSRLPLPSIKARAGDYKVVAHLKGPQALSVTYRPSPQANAATPGSAADLSADFEFQSLARPRGLGGKLGDRFRTFITFPIRFTGLRFPAKSSRLSTSSDITAVQLTGIRAGMLAVLEPWNYNTRQNPAWIPYRLMTGFNIFDLSTGKSEPAFLLGASITLPVLGIDGTPNARNLSSALAIGLFWEVDLERQHPFKDGNHALLTVGMDLTSLLSE